MIPQLFYTLVSTIIPCGALIQLQGLSRISVALTGILAVEMLILETIMKLLFILAYIQPLIGKLYMPTELLLTFIRVPLRAVNGLEFLLSLILLLPRLEHIEPKKVLLTRMRLSSVLELRPPSLPNSKVLEWAYQLTPNTAKSKVLPGRRKTLSKIRSRSKLANLFLCGNTSSRESMPLRHASSIQTSSPTLRREKLQKISLKDLLNERHLALLRRSID